jgi:hypothetical protein
MLSGRQMPVEGTAPEVRWVHVNAPGHPQVVLITDAGIVVRGREGAKDHEGVTPVVGRESHFATCSGAEVFRR